MELRYALLHIRRSPVKCLAIAAVSFVFVLLILLMHIVLNNQQQELDTVLDTMPITAVISDIYGTTYDGLTITPIYVDLLYNEQSNLAPFIKDPCIKRGIQCAVVDESGASLPSLDTTKLVGITSLAADPLLREENGVTIRYEEGYDDGILSTEKRVCLMNQALIDAMGHRPDTLYLDFTQVTEARRQEVDRFGKPMPGGEDVGIIALTVVGVVDGGIPDAIYCPWAITKGIDTAIYANYTANSMSFTVGDNRRLNDLKQMLSGYIDSVLPGYSGGGGSFDAVALTIQDGEFVRVVGPLERSINFISAVLPLLLVLAVGIGFLASFLFIRNRKPEFAIMRSLGARSKRVFLTAFVEQLMLCFAGSALALLLVGIFGGIRWQGALYALLFFVCFMAGSTVSVLRILSINVMAIMKAKE